MISKGSGLIPGLEVRKRGPSGQLERWEIYKKEETSKELSRTEENNLDNIGALCARAEEGDWWSTNFHNRVSYTTKFVIA